MKTRIKIIVIVALLILSACSSNTAQQSYGPNATVSFQVFYDQLSPYGIWVNYPPYGYVWVPDVGWGFAPYVTAGNWVYTSYGWTWHSYYQWGWASFHYGRWFYDNWFGWVWIPDTVWAPAWVAWSIGGGYCGWAPLGPNVSVNVVVRGKQSIPQEHWVFVRDRDLAKRSIDHYRIKRTMNSEILENALLVRDTREHRNVSYIPGPDKNVIQKAAGKQINPISVRERNKPGSDRVTNNEFELFKPHVQRENANAHKTVPNKVFDLKDIEKNPEGYPSKRNSGQYNEKSQLRQNYPGKGKDHQGNSGNSKPRKGKG